jgi:hypothetical protein
LEQKYLNLIGENLHNSAKNDDMLVKQSSFWSSF